MYKQLDLGTVDPLTLEPRISVLDLDRSVKLAGDIKEYILELRPSPGKTLLHVIALGAYEFYGPNRNKDSFAEYHNGPGAKLSLPDVAIHPDYSGLLEQFKGLGVHDGRKVFETFNDANAFEHHKNKDPNKRIGDVLKSFYNNDMHRVELIISLDHSRCPSKFIDKINSGDMLAFSMGCHIKFDFCSACGNRAPTRAQYCEHAKNMHLPGHEFASDGTPISVFNPNAKFFDISIVFRPADRIGYQLKKIANDAPIFSADVGADVAVYNQVKDAAGKLADMDKRVRGFVKDVRHIPAKLEVAVKSLPKYLPDELDLDKLSSAPFGDLINTAHAEGIVFGAAEIAGILANKWHGGVKLSHIRKLAEYVPLALSMIQQSPETVCEIVDTGIFSGRYSAKLAEDLGPIKASRGCDREDLLKQAFLGGHKAWHGLDDIGIPHPQEGVTTPVIVGDEQSNLDAVNLAAKDSKIKTLIKALTAGLLVGGAYRLFTGSGGLGAGLLGASGVGLHDLLSKNPVIPFGDYQKSDVGVIPTETLLFKKGEEFKIVRASEIDANLAHNKCAQAELLLEDASFGVIVQRLSTILEGDFLGVSD